MLPVYDDCVSLYHNVIYAVDQITRDAASQDYIVCTTALDMQAFHAPESLGSGATLISVMVWFAPTVVILLVAHLALGLTRIR